MLNRVTGVRSTLPISVLVPVLYLLLATALFSAAWRQPAYLSVGSAGDAQIYMWMLGWAPYSVSHGLNPLFTDFDIYPQGASLFWSLIPIFPGFVLSPVMTLLGPVVTYNLTMTLGLAGSAWCAYLAIKAFVADRLASWLGGLLYGFSPYMLAHSLGHPNLVLCMEPPLALLLLTELLVWQRRPAWVVGLGLGVLGAVQILTTPEILFTTVIVGVLCLIVLAVIGRRQVMVRLRAASSGLAVSLIVFVAISALPLGFALLGPGQVHGVVREQDIYVNDALNFVIPTNVMLLAPARLLDLTRHWTGDIAEYNGYVGVPLAALLLYVAITSWRRSSLIRWAAISAAIAATLSLGPHLHVDGRIHFHIPLPWLLVQHLPFFDNVLPSRLMLFFYLLAGLAVAFFVKEATTESRGWRKGASMTWVALSFLLLLPRVPWPVTPNPVPSFFSGPLVNRVPDGSVALVAPFSTAPGFQPGPGQDSATLPMLWQQASGMRFRMPAGGLNVPDVNGLPTGGRPPQSVTQTAMLTIQEGHSAPELTPQLRASIQADLNRWRIQTVIVGPMYNQQEMIRFFSSLLGREPEAEGGVYVWWGVQS